MGLRALFLNHVWLKLFSLLLAVLLWLAVHANENRQTISREFGPHEATTNFIARPVAIMTDSGAHASVRVEPPTVDVAIRGRIPGIGRLDPGDVRVFVRIPDRPGFEGTVPVYVQLPPETALVMVSPAIVRVRADPLP